jgi:hypothetical protein
MDIENSENLLTFINKEKKQFNNFNYTKTLDTFFRIFIKNIIEMNQKLNKIDNRDTIVITGTNILFNIFICLLNYTNNLTLSIFLSERSVLLYSEFIILSRDPEINKDLYYIPTITDAINFSYKKTIGPLNIETLNFYKNNKIKNSCILLKEIIQKIYIQTQCNNDFEQKASDIYSKIIKTYKHLDDKNLDIILNNIRIYCDSKENIVENIQTFLEGITRKNK